MKWLVGISPSVAMTGDRRPQQQITMLHCMAVFNIDEQLDTVHAWSIKMIHVTDPRTQTIAVTYAQQCTYHHLNRFIDRYMWCETQRSYQLIFFLIFVNRFFKMWFSYFFFCLCVYVSDWIPEARRHTNLTFLWRHRSPTLSSVHRTFNNNYFSRKIQNNTVLLKCDSREITN